MNTPKIIVFTLVSLFICCHLSAQMKMEHCQDLRSRFTTMTRDTSITEIQLFHIETKGNKQELNYVTPLRKVFLSQIACSFDSWQSITSMISMTGAYQDVMRITRQHIEHESKSESLEAPDDISGKLSLMDISSLVDSIDTGKVVMINEAHDRIQPRAFILSILPMFKSKGFTHLAMETLNYSDLKDVSLHTGYYTSEPMFGEVVREALRLGFTLVPYEDTNAIKHSNLERETAQATNLANVIKTAPKESKFLIIGGYAHIGEDILGDAYSTMAVEFKKISGINPFTIDQVISLEENRYPDDSILHKLSKGLTTAKTIINTSGIISASFVHYDAFIVHPSTKLVNCLPNWLTCNGMKKDFSVKCNNKKAVLIQAYYKKEISSNQSYQTRVPADQTFYLDEEGFAHLFLIPGNSYVITFRDENNKIIQTRTIKM